PRGGPHGACGACARARLHARVHDRVRPRNRRGCAHRVALRPRRPRRQPPVARGSLAGCRARRRRAASGRAPGARRLAGVSPTRYLILAEGFSRDQHYGKTMWGVLRYRRDDVVAILDSTRAPGEQEEGIPVVQRVDDALSFEPDTALVGVATQGGRFPPAWIELLRACIVAGLDVENGLHVFLSGDQELRELASRHGGELPELRRPAAE